mmetsp:Transcript_52743/g.83723  ORF Transcript_52743/g.83723 Transcript_52743/m.83723 type:complete len:177 (+) Transcript_52743:71-601(+)
MFLQSLAYVIAVVFSSISLQSCMVTAQSPKHNVKGGMLSSCSKPGTALTGFTRSGSCVDYGDDDAGSHHICIEMKPDFCSVTGQPDWCSGSMQCMGQAGNCKIGNWCVCQWAFAAYIERAGGCDAIVNVDCDGTNMAALRAYRQEAQSDDRIRKALECLEKRCGLKQESDVDLQLL